MTNALGVASNFLAPIITMPNRLSLVNLDGQLDFDNAKEAGIVHESSRSARAASERIAETVSLKLHCFCH